MNSALALKEAVPLTKSLKGMDTNNSSLSKRFAIFSKAELDRAEQFLTLSEQIQKDFLAQFDEVKNTLPPPLPDINDNSYETLKPYSRMSKDEVKNFIKENWGQWLVAFNKELKTDAITRKQLKAYDKRLMQKIEKMFTPSELAGLSSKAAVSPAEPLPITRKS